MPLNMRLGKQVISWGESTFIFNGINVINPVDVGAIRAPGAEVKEALLPVNMFYSSLGLTENVTVEGFLQLEWEKTEIEESTGDKKMEGKKAGATGWLVKPFNPDQLLATIKKVLG